MKDDKSYLQYITPEYDEKFSAVPNIKWDPWVGKEYHKTGILILGMITLDSKDGVWDKYARNHRDTSRQIVYDTDKDKFDNGSMSQPITKMFLDGAGQNSTSEGMLEKFWRSVAFNNFVQCVVAKDSQLDALEQFKPEEIGKSKRALAATFDIIKPNFCLILGVSVADCLGLDGGTWRAEKINGTCPRVIPQNGNQPPIVGVRHTSKYFSPKEWFKFSQDDPVSKNPVANFINYLTALPA